MIDFLALALGIVLLFLGGTVLVRGASEIAARFGVSPLIVGLTVVGFGTSAPELAVNISGVLRGATALAFGNVIGSNISNMGLVLGVAALLMPIKIQGEVVRRDVPLLLLATTVIMVMAVDAPAQGRPAVIGRSDAIVLLLLFLVFVYITALNLSRARESDPLLREIELTPLVDTRPQGRFSWLLVALGIVLLFVGGKMCVDHGSALANQIGISETIIGLFVVAVGTSLPELATSAIAAVRHESDLALGNVVGSNIFNSLIVLPASALAADLPVPRGGAGDIVLSWVLVALLIPVFFLGEARMGRKTGFILLAIYFGYAIVRIIGERS